MLAHSLSLEDLFSIHSHPEVTRLLDAVDGRNGFESEVRNAMAEASLLRNGIPALSVEFQVSNSIVAKICFLDGICWAAKMEEIRRYDRDAKYAILPYDRATLYGIQATMLVERYCPNIPIAKFRGFSQDKLQYCFTEWVGGKPPNEEVLGNTSVGTTISIPEKIVISLAEFVYNLTTCPIPKKEISMMQLDDLGLQDFVARNSTPLEGRNATTWAKDQFVAWHLLHGGSGHSVKPFDGLDKMLLLSWVRRKFSGLDDRTHSFVLHYWDLRLPNILIDEDSNLLAAKSVIDWDDVSAVPLKLSAVSIRESLWNGQETKLDSKQAQLFQHELSRIERNLSSHEWSKMFLHSKENKFLNDILRPRKEPSFANLRLQYRELLAEALHRTPETLKLATSEWKAFTDETFRNRGRPVPDWPQYIEIQEALGLYGRSSFERTLRKFKRTTQKRLDVLWDKFCEGWWNGWKGW